MRYFDAEESNELRAESWMLDLLGLNPSYCSWGPSEDYMCDKDAGWRSPIIVDSWQAFKADFTLDELNECVNFYFEVRRARKECPDCLGTGYAPETRQIGEDFYDFQKTGRRWCDNLEQDEVDLLWKEGRLFGEFPDAPPPAAVFNEHLKKNVAFHDGINRFILIRHRATKLGFKIECDTCAAKGYVFTEDHATLSLILWWLHPRKGCSRGIRVDNIQPSDVAEIQAFMIEAADRNAQRFELIRNFKGLE